MPDRKPNLHFSGMEMLSSCGVKYEFRYEKGIKTPHTVAQGVGLSTHDSVEHDMKSVLATGKLLEVEEVKAIARDTLVHKWENGEIEIDPDEAVRGEKAVRDQSIDSTVSLAELHRVKVAPHIQPTAVERQWVITLDGYPMDLAGRIDIQSGRQIRDTKTANKTPSADNAHNALQLTMYGLAAKIIDGEAPTEFVLDNLVKSKKPDYVPQVTYRNDEDYRMLMRRIERSIETIERGIYMPASPSDWRCSAKYCSYWKICPFAKRPVSVSMAGVYPTEQDLKTAVEHEQSKQLLIKEGGLNGN